MKEKREKMPAFKKRAQSKVQNKSDFSDMTVTDFMSSTFDTDSDESNDESEAGVNIDTMRQVNGKTQCPKGSDDNDDDDDDDDKEIDDDDDDDGEEKEMGQDASDGNEVADSDEGSEADTMFDSHAHRKSLQKLRESDPDFFKFLEENDKQLLQFNASDSDDDGSGEDKEEDKVHRPPEELEVASDESDFEAEGRKPDGKVVTLKMVQDLHDQLENKNSLSALKKAARMFHSALQRVSAPKGDDSEPLQYIVEGSAVFNAVVQMCVLELQPAIKRFLRLPPTGKPHIQINNCRKWTLVKPMIREYLRDLLQFLGCVSSSHIIAVLLKHLHQIAIFVTYFPKLKRPILKKLIKLWGSAEETVRVIAFLCVLKITTNDQQEILEQALKMMYMTYVSNCKFVSPLTLPLIQFMRRSLAEMFALDEAASYQYIFLYVRQLAIHLRNAITFHTKDTLQSVYNWQFIQSLHLWAEVLGATAVRPCLQPLLYPLVQVIIGTIKLIPTAQYYPLRFHCVQMLIHLSKKTGTFIPVLPFLLEVLDGYNFNKPHKKASMKPVDFTCILRLSKSQLMENSFKDTVIETIYQQMLEYLASESHTISFPDTVVPTVIQLKKFVKNCKFANHSRKIKQILEKVEENSRVIKTERSKATFPLTDRKAIDAWETNMKLKGTPLASYYESWNKMNIQKMAKKFTQNEKIGDFKLPVLKKHVKKEADDGPVVLFPSSDDSDAETATTKSAPTTKRKKKHNSQRVKRKRIQESIVGMDSVKEDDDIVQDLKLSDLE